MDRSGTNIAMIGGVALLLFGAVTLAVPIFSTQQTKDVATVGDLKLQTTQSQSYTIPPTVSGGALIVGIALLGAGLYRRS